jgi:hypothetical protein
MKNRLPVIVHRRKLFEWIVKDPQQCYEMDQPGLAAFINKVATDADWLRKKGDANYQTFKTHYAWQALKENYFQLLFGHADVPVGTED